MYYAIHKDFAAPMLTTYPDAALHGEFYVIGEMPKNFDSEPLELYKAGLDNTGEYGLTPSQFLALVNAKLSQVYVGQLIIFSGPQGRLLKAENPAFKSLVVTGETVD